ncbi:hypothetical protein ILYODFUR_031123 [Ilyodon furcidens]|uniref:Uncharacterized protein n=1 Tax=Ilyodon furcidens TaxID=33524 RepID=A0ABV0T5G0_9TELE
MCLKQYNGQMTTVVMYFSAASTLQASRTSLKGCDRQLSFDPPPPHLQHQASSSPSPLSPQASTPPPVSGSQGEVFSNSNPNTFIQAHVIISIHVFHRGPSAKREINIS